MMSKPVPIRRSVKTIDPSWRVFPGWKPRQKAFSFATLIAVIAGVIFIPAPVNFLAVPAPMRDGVLSKRLSYPVEPGVEHTELSRSMNKTVSKWDPAMGESGKCLKHVLYDKPVKTGSTAITFAIRKYLKQDGRRDMNCGNTGPQTCIERAQAVCNGKFAEKDYFSIIGHLQRAPSELVACLRPHYYVATSIRDPFQRRKSAFLWNRTKNGTHFAIPHTASFGEFMNRLPRCQLFDYYDGRGMDCDVGMPITQRIDEIVARVDEVIDIHDEPAGPLHRLISKFLGRENESIKVEEKEFLTEFDRDTLKEETMLYNRLKEMRTRPVDMNRLPC